MARLKVFVFDHRAGAAGGDPSSAALPAHENGQQDGMLLHALLADLGALSDVEIVVGPGAAAAAAGARHGEVPTSAPAPASDSVGAALETMAPAPRFGARGGAHAGFLRGPHADARADIPADDHLDAGMQAADAVWPLACASGCKLEQVSQRILHGKRILLGSAPGAVAVAASKLALARVLAAGGVAAVATYSPHDSVPEIDGPWVVKPDDGVGCRDTRLFGDRAQALAWIRASAADGYVLQPFAAGKLGSLSLICRDGTAHLLACNQERVAMRDNRFHFLGSVVNGMADDDGALARLAQQVAAAIPGLWGHVGVDFVLTAQGTVVLDVNPRLTAAYAGLHASLGCNPAGLVLDLLKGQALAAAPTGRRRAVSVDVGAC